MIQQSSFATGNSVKAKVTSNQDKAAWLAIIAWAVFISLVLLARGGRFLAPIFPISAVAVGLFLFQRSLILYAGFTWWLVFLGSLIRRIIDFQSGYITFGRWHMTALLVMSISLLTFFKHLPTIHKRGGLPFLLAFTGLFYAFFIGGFAYGRIDARFILAFLEWLAPVAFGFHLFTQWRSYPQYRQVHQKVFVLGALVMGSYGIYQFCIAPPWDNFYLSQIGATSFGKPEPFGIRVFGTISSPQGFSTVMTATLILLLSSQGILRFPASGAGYLAFLLARARSAWLGWCVSILMFVPSLNQRLQMRLLITILVMVFFVVPLATIEPFAEVIQERLESFDSSDGSYQARQEGYQELTGLALTQFVGRGLGGNVTVDGFGGADTGILPLLFSLGWFGTIPYLGGMMLIFLKLFQNQEIQADPFAGAARSIALGVFSQVWFNQIFSNEFAMILWGFLGIGLAACKYYFWKNNYSSYSNSLRDDNTIK